MIKNRVDKIPAGDEVGKAMKPLQPLRYYWVHCIPGSKRPFPWY